MTECDAYDISMTGLNPVTKASMKMFIRDILSLEEIPNSKPDPGTVFLYKSHVVNRVELVGIIVRADIRDRRHSYAVDDGTGVLICNVWKRKRHKTLETFEEVEDLPQSLKDKQKEIHSHLQVQDCGFSIGDCVLVRGRIVPYQNRKEVDVLEICPINNPNYEVERVLQLPDLYATCYNQPFVPPTAFVPKDENKKEKTDAEVLCEAIVDYIHKNVSMPNIFSLKDALSWPFQCTWSSNGNTEERLQTLLAALQLCEKKEVLVKRSDHNSQYEIIQPGCNLTRKAIHIIQTLCQGAEYGCHEKEVYKQLRDLPQYSSISTQAVSTVLKLLESNSDVICVSPHRYLCID